MNHLRYYLTSELETLAQLLESNNFTWIAEDVRSELERRGY